MRGHPAGMAGPERIGFAGEGRLGRSGRAARPGRGSRSPGSGTAVLAPCRGHAVALQLGRSDSASSESRTSRRRSIDEFPAGLAEWADREADEDSPFESGALWELVVRRGGRLPYPQRVFIESWSRRIAELGPDRVDDGDRLRALVTERELRLKRARARLANQNRLMDWSPGGGVGRMDFRWLRVRQLLIDLHRGLAA